MGDVAEKLKGYTVIKEGEAEILMHASNSVFFNKAQVNNRDMSIAILRTFIAKRQEEHAAILDKKRKLEEMVLEGTSGSILEEEAMAPHVEETNGGRDMPLNQSVEGEEDNSQEPRNMKWKGPRELKAPKVLEALAASGLRALRYAREVDGIGQVIALDNDKASVEACKKNIQFNGSLACSKVEAHLADARVYMLTHPKEFDVVDLDPYGSPSVFLDSAVQSVADGGILMCTATDMAVLCGGSGESHANRYKRYIVPILSVHMDFYIRVFVRIFTSASEIKNTPLKLSYVYQCVGCDSFHLQSVGRVVSKNNSMKPAPGFGPVVPQQCSHCGKKYNMGGPIWSAPMHNQEWVLSILASVKAMKERYPAYEKITAVLTTVSEELHDIPLFLSLHNLCATLKCTSPSAVMFRSAVINAGYRISGSHVNPLGLKSDAPMDVIWDIMRCWVNSHPIRAQPPDHSGTVILSKEPTLQANFARAAASLSKAQVKKVKRFLPNPERHWGPKVRAGRQITSKHSSLLGPQSLNESHNREEDEGNEGNGAASSEQSAEGEANEHNISKRQKTDDALASEP
ncbi:putative tRNA (guanine(26)-N(2))-dimethyltransferase 1 [Ananas comosus]|uniref:tRNA (guanine(26)-N(2))-dimethyltransferase n=1 Tax=Ananas comosus TaxID=4615 RepID=A0A199VEB1_ANACO|nr:putative tRNA (guanine(26)-N(2))-dimethyltransferase 1 [Ananas comosus]